jgi:hypothetical protein
MNPDMLDALVTPPWQVLVFGVVTTLGAAVRRARGAPPNARSADDWPACSPSLADAGIELITGRGRRFNVTKSSGRLLHVDDGGTLAAEVS